MRHIGKCDKMRELKVMKPFTMAGSFPEEEEAKQEMMFAVKAFMVGLRAQMLSKQRRNVNEANNKKKSR